MSIELVQTVPCARSTFRCMLSEVLSLQKEELIGEDAAYFDVEQQSTGKWVFFTVELAVVLGIMYVVGHSNTLQPPKHHWTVRSYSTVSRNMVSRAFSSWPCPKMIIAWAY